MTTTSEPQALIVGAGLAGLTCARELARRGVTAIVLEASEAAGGRVRSDVVEGFVLDRGFQVLFDAYPAVRRQLDIPALRLRYFDPGAIICGGGRRFVLTDPLRDQDGAAVWAAALTGIVSPLDKLRTLLLAQQLKRQSIEQVLAGEDEPTVVYLRRRGFSERCIDVFFRPFYGGIFLDRSLNTSAKCFRFDFKMLSDGGTCLPAAGMGELSRQLATPLQERGQLRLGSRVQELLFAGGRVVGVRLHAGGELRAQAVIVATEAAEALRLSQSPMPQGYLQTTTVYLVGSQPLYAGKKLLLNADPHGLVNNAQQLSNVAAEYAPPGRHLLSATVLGRPPCDDAELCAGVVRDLRAMLWGDEAAQRALDGYYPLRVYRIGYAQFAQPPGIHPRLPDNQSATPGLYFAGEFTEASSLNAAMVSGEKCAELVARAVAG